MSKLVNYRLANESDLNEIMDLFNYYIENSNDIYDEHPREEIYMNKWWRDKEDMGFPVFIAEKENELIGFASYGTFRRWEGYSCTVEHSVYVKAENQFQGIGKKLLQLLIDEASQKGFHSLVGGIDADNESSLRFHKKFGFEERGRIPEVAKKNGKFLELVLLQKILNKSSKP